MLLIACHAPVDSKADSPPESMAVSEPYNVVMLSIDTLRRKALGRYSGGSDTPTLDRLAQEGLVLDQHLTCSAWTLPGVICALTGKQPQSWGILPRILEDPDAIADLPQGTPTLASRLQEAGYQTTLITSNIHLGEDGGTDQGYQHVELYEQGTADMVAEAALSQELVEPFFLHAHFLDPHSPYAPPAAWRTALEGRPELPWDLSTEQGLLEFSEAMSGLDEATILEAQTQVQLLYAGEVAYTDSVLGELLIELEARGALENTLVVIWSDHGEQFWEHNGRGHNSSLYAEENDGIALFWAPGLIKAQSWTKPSSSLDITPTVLDILKIPIEDSMEGVSILSASEHPIFGTLWPRERAPLQSVLSNDTRLIYSWTGNQYFFDRSADPSELQPLSLDDPRIIDAWKLLLPEVQALEPLVSEFSPVDPGP
jgi:arylsulfatase A-like enzyme